MKTLYENLYTAVEPDMHTGTGGTGMPYRL
jgi:hypothetical protein